MTPANPAMPALDTWTDLSGFNQLRAKAQADQKSALPAVARQFEALFTQMMLKSMREANASLGGDTLAGSQEGDTYRQLFDQQLSLSLANGHNGLGIARMLVRQLGGTGAEQAPSQTPAPAGSLPAPGLPPGGPAGVQALLALGRDGAAGRAEGSLLPLTADAGVGAHLRDALGELAHGAGEVAGAAGKLLPGGDPVAFVRALAPQARAAAARLGVSVRALLAQAALETGWGRHLPQRGDGASSFNLFGIKAGQGWEGGKVNVPTIEYEDGVAVRRHDSFRAYDTPAASFEDYARLIAGNPRYAQALGQGEDVAAFAHALSRGGYATDPAYAAKLTAIADGPQMRQALAALDGERLK